MFFLAVGFLRPQGHPLWLNPPIAALPYIVLTFGLVFGWYFASSRMILSLLLLTLADRALVLFPADGTGQTMVAMTAFLVPLNLLAFSILKEDSVTSIRGLTRVIVVLAQPFLLLWLCLPEQQDLAVSFTQEIIPSHYTTWAAIPQPGLCAFAVALSLHSIRFVLHRDPMESGAIWALLTVFVAYHASRYGWQATNFFMAAGLILFVSLLQSVYRRTYRDELTGIPGRLAYDEAIGQLGRKFSIAVIGIDQLTHYANTHGRPVSEQVLKLVANRVHTTCAGGQAFRTTGEELTVLFPGKSARETLVPLETVRKAIDAINLFLRGQDRVWEKQWGTRKTGSCDQALPLSISIGVADKSEDDTTPSQVIKWAYRALYEAKGAGGNVVKRVEGNVNPARRSHAGSGRIIANSEYGA